MSTPMDDSSLLKLELILTLNPGTGNFSHDCIKKKFCIMYVSDFFLLVPFSYFCDICIANLAINLCTVCTKLQWWGQLEQSMLFGKQAVADI